MSYTDPKLPSKNPMSEAVSKSIMDRDKIMYSNAASDNTEKNITSIFQGGINLLTAKKKAISKLNKNVLKEDQKIYDKVGGFSTEYEGFNEKSEAFFGELIEKYNTIKTHLNSGSLKDPSLGKKDLASLKSLVDQYGKAIPKVLAIADQIDMAAKKAGEEGMGAAGTLSVTGAPPGQLAIIKKISSGGISGEEIEIKHEGGTIILRDKKTGAELNVREFNRAMSSKENPYLKLVPDLSKGMTVAYDSFNKNNKGLMQDTFTKVADGQDPESPDAVRIMSANQEIKLKEALMGPMQQSFVNGGTEDTKYRTGGVFKEMYRQHAESIWEDKMPEEMTKGKQWPEEPPAFGDDGWEEFYENFKAPMLDYLATVTIQENATDIQRETQNNSERNKKYEIGREFKGGTEEYNKKLNKFFEKADMSLEDQKKLKEAKPGDEVEVTLYGKKQKLIKDA